MLLRNITTVQNIIGEYKWFLYDEEKSTRTVETYTSNIKSFLNYLSLTPDSPTELDLVTRTTLKEYQLFCKVKLKNSENTVYIKMASLRSFFDYLFSKNLIQSNPTEYLSMKTIPSADFQVSNILDLKTYNRLRRIIHQNRHPMHILLFELLTRFKIKPNTICSIKVSQVKLTEDSGSLIIRHSSNTSYLVLDVFLIDLFRDWLLIRQYKSCDHDLLFITERNTPLTYHSLRYAIMKYHKTLGIHQSYNLNSYFHFYLGEY